jgi:putative ABC transport system permease protein
MSQIALLGALEIGLVYALVALGVFLSFRVLSFPDLTVDGSFPLGAAVAASAIVGGIDPYLATGCAIVAGALAGLVTAVLNVRFRILHLLASILTMIALFSINLRIMGRPNIALLTEPTVLSPFEGLGLAGPVLKPLLVGAIVLAVAALLARFLASDYGLGMRATGANPRMARAQGIDTGLTICVGMALSNAMVALAGALFAQTNGFADVTIGTGTIVVGLAAVIVGETILPARRIGIAIVACVLGSILYRLAIAAALNADVLGLEASDLNLVTAVLVGLALILPGARNPLKALALRRARA